MPTWKSTYYIRDGYSQDWILDLGASFHVTPHRDWFSLYDSGCVHLGNNYACDIVGTSDIKFSFANGSSFFLKNVHVPKLSKSLILVVSWMIINIILLLVFRVKRYKRALWF